ncbi:MAG: cytochrome b/b6 domain-containing protein [Pseudomonadota bacterium]
MSEETKPLDDPIRVWDLPVRLFHWSLLICIVGAITTADSGDMDRHAQFGFAALVLVVFRIIWGFVGSETARFAHFVRPPPEILAYAKEGRWRGIGHNPLGGLSVIVLLGLVLAKVLTGLFSNDDILFDGPWVSAVSKETSDWLTGLHYDLTNILYAFIALHIGAVFWAAVKGDELIGPMVGGRKRLAVDEPRQAPLWLAVPVLAGAVILAGFVFRYWIT